MDTIVLVKPAMEHHAQALEYIEEHLAAGETTLQGAYGLREMPYPNWLTFQETVPDGWVPQTTFWGMRESDCKIVGIINIRHQLNEFLRSYAGHIGYGVRPSQRKKGYASRMLALALEHCRALGLEKAMLACDTDNIASATVIQRAGGVLEKEDVHPDGSPIQLYWINLS